MQTSFLLALLVFAFPAVQQAALPAPDRTVPTHGIMPVLTASAHGVQIYQCTLQETSPQWVLVAPQATLFQGLEQVGTHSAGPMWKWRDGSAIVGTVLEKQPAKEPGAVPWLLLSAKPAPGSNTAGRLTGIAYVRRSETHGGAAPVTGCDAQHIAAQARIAYTANYTFYKADPAQQ